MISGAVSGTASPESASRGAAIRLPFGILSTYHKLIAAIALPPTRANSEPGIFAVSFSLLELLARG